MESGVYHSMKDLINSIRNNLGKLENGDLQANELPALVAESRELYERLVILRYKAQEKALLAADEPKAPDEKANEQRTTPFKLNLGTVQAQQTSLLDAEPAKEEKPMEQKPEIVQQTLQVKNPDSVAHSHDVRQVDQQLVQSTEASVNDKLSQGQTKVSLAEKLQKKAIADLRTAIGLNQKFLFMNDLFEGENAAYNEALHQLNSFSNLDDAKNLLLTLGTRYNWDLESESVLQFTDLVERRYA